MILSKTMVMRRRRITQLKGQLPRIALNVQNQPPGLAIGDSLPHTRAPDSVATVSTFEIANINTPCYITIPAFLLSINTAEWLACETRSLFCINHLLEHKWLLLPGCFIIVFSLNGVGESDALSKEEAEEEAGKSD